MASQLAPERARLARQEANLDKVTADRQNKTSSRHKKQDLLSVLQRNNSERTPSLSGANHC